MNTITVRIQVAGVEKVHVLGLVELHGGYRAVNPYYRHEANQIGLIELDAKRIVEVGGTEGAYFYAGILLEIDRVAGGKDEKV